MFSFSPIFEIELQELRLAELAYVEIEEAQSSAKIKFAASILYLEELEDVEVHRFTFQLP